MKLFVENITTIDLSILRPNRGIIGDSFIVDITLQGDVGQDGMIIDFSLVKKIIKKEVENLADHVLVIPNDNDSVRLYQSDLRCDVILYSSKSEVRSFISAPKKSFLLLNTVDFSIEVLEDALEKHLLNTVPVEIKGLKVSLRHERMSGQSYRYSHGLKKHDGDCQRIAHGHRSAIRIYIDGQQSTQWEAYWAEKWDQCYLVSQDDIISEAMLSACAKAHWHEGLTAHGYLGSQGYFEAMTLTTDTDLIPSDTTVELLAQHIKNIIQLKLPDSAIEVHAYEGIGKGAIA